MVVIVHRFDFFPSPFMMRSETLFLAVRLQDDIIDDAQSFVAVAQVLKNHGAYKIYVIATHGLLSADAPDLLESSPITEVNCATELETLRC